MTAKMGMWRETITGTATGTTITVESAAVPDGERRFLVRSACKTDTTDNADVVVYLVSHGQEVMICGMVDMTTTLAKSQRHMMWLTEGEYLRFNFSGIVNGEVVSVGITGHIQYRDRK